MSNSKEISIELSRTKLLFLLIGSLAVAAIGGWVLTIELSQSSDPFQIPVTIWLVSIAAIIFGGGFTIFPYYKLFDTRPGIIFSETGLFDNSSAVSAGFIPWSEVTGVSLYKMQYGEYIIIHVTDPGKYLACGNPIKRWLAKGNFKMCGSPIFLSPSILKIDFSKLYDLLKSHIEQYDIHAAPKRASYVSPFAVSFDDNEVIVSIDGKRHESVRWDDLIFIGIRIIENQRHIGVPYWIFGGRAGGCMYPINAVEYDKGMNEFENRLPGFYSKKTYLTIGEAMVALDGEFVVWERPTENST
jgi:hypothetical protein